jgi:hypothetical protein
MEGKGGGLILRYYPGICLKELRKTKNFSQDCRPSNSVRSPAILPEGFRGFPQSIQENSGIVP